MCQRATCRTCGKATYRGCGNHVEQVLAGVPRSQRCQCGPSERGSGGGLLSRLLGSRRP
jgi:hypothetical protein